MTGLLTGKPAIALVCLLVLLGGWMGSAAVASSGEVLGGVVVAGVEVSGLQATQLMQRLAPAARAFAARPMTLAAGSRTWTRTPESMGITVDLRRSALSALRVGRTSTFAWMLYWLGSPDRKLQWVPKIDEAGLKASLAELEKLVKVEASNGDFTVNGAQVKVTPPRQGTALETAAARKVLIKAAMNPPAGDRLALPVKRSAPQVRQEQLDRVKRQAEAILRDPVEFVFKSRTFRIAADRIAPALKLAGPAAGASSPVLAVDPVVLKNQIIAAAPFVETKPIDARLTVTADKISRLPSVDGETIETSQAAADLIGLAAGQRRPIQLKVVPQPAAFTTADASNLGINGRISSFTTAFDSRNAPRVSNIDRMAQAINGKVLRPGETFSLNGATGARTLANGYQEAGVLVDGELVPGIGGGVCQVATTLFNAVYEAGLQVIERGNHSLYISKYPKGRDAMVNFGVQDLRFKNDTPYGLLLQARVSAKDLTVSIYSSPLGRTFTETTSPETNPRVPPVKYVDDPLLPKGSEVVTAPGIAGFDVTVVRKVMQGDKLLRTDTFVSKYAPWKRIIKRGVGPASLPAPAPAGPAPAPAPPVQPVAPPPPGGRPAGDPVIDPMLPTDLPPPPVPTG